MSAVVQSTSGRRRIRVQGLVHSGGVFQNRLLTERTVPALQAAGFQVFLHEPVPPNDGGISLGQAIADAILGRR